MYLSTPNRAKGNLSMKDSDYNAQMVQIIFNMDISSPIVTKLAPTPPKSPKGQKNKSQ